jgi:hypothetical protein
VCSSDLKNTLAGANENRSWKIWAEFALVIMLKAQRLYTGEKLAVDLDADLFGCKRRSKTAAG